MGVVRRRSWGRVSWVKERRRQVDAAPPGSELGAGIGVASEGGSGELVLGLGARIGAGRRDWGRVWGRRNGDGRDPSWAVLVVRRRGLGSGSVTVEVGRWWAGVESEAPDRMRKTRRGKPADRARKWLGYGIVYFIPRVSNRATIYIYIYLCAILHPRCRLVFYTQHPTHPSPRARPANLSTPRA